LFSPDVLQDVSERAKLLLPIANGPCGAVEMSDGVRTDLVSAAISALTYSTRLRICSGDPPKLMRE
jgi:hypothetical protein